MRHERGFRTRRSQLREFSAVLCAVALGACSEESPFSADERATSPLAPARGAVVTQTEPITEIFPGSPIDEGTATLTRDAAGIWLAGNSPDLVDGDAYTVWGVIFDNPSGCVGGCGGDDLNRPSAQATVSNVGGFVADASGDFEIHLARHDASRQTLVGVGRSGINNPYQAEIHFIFRTHGTAETDPDNLAAQTSLVGAFCNPCQDQGLSIFLPPGAPGQGN